MAVLERSELDASSLSDLHAIADQLGLDGFRRLRKAELVDAILERSGADGSAEADGERGASAPAEESRSPARAAGALPECAAPGDQPRRSARPPARPP